mmetsp:Transcript_81058/g.173298  ORF Transcript_81058/g.173298 Transcript_81058/m.173298 type:complete len:255 (-) Transcript_81058:2013-2777(-)
MDIPVRSHAQERCLKLIPSPIRLSGRPIQVRDARSIAPLPLSISLVPTATQPDRVHRQEGRQLPRDCGCVHSGLQGLLLRGCLRHGHALLALTCPLCLDEIAVANKCIGTVPARLLNLTVLAFVGVRLSVSLSNLLQGLLLFGLRLDRLLLLVLPAFRLFDRLHLGLRLLLGLLSGLSLLSLLFRLELGLLLLLLLLFGLYLRLLFGLLLGSCLLGLLLCLCLGLLLFGNCLLLLLGDLLGFKAFGLHLLFLCQ